MAWTACCCSGLERCAECIDMKPDPRVVEYAEAHGLSAAALDEHLEAEHGWERHDRGYAEVIPSVAQCMASGGCAL